MDNRTFIANLFASAVWPLVTLLIAGFFRKPILTLIPAIQKLRWRGLEAEFGKGIQHARELIDSEAKTSQESTRDAFPNKDRELLQNLADLSPRYVVLEAWRDVEAAIASADGAAAQSSSRTRRSNISTAAKHLFDSGVFQDAEFQVFQILRTLRNRAAHEKQFELSKDDAVEYAAMARWLIDAINSTKRVREPAP